MSPLVLVVPDGASDPLGSRPTCLQDARTPALDRLAARGELRRVRTIPAGLPAGTEVGLPRLLGARLRQPLPRGRVEAAAAGVELVVGEAAWRLDTVPAVALDAAAVARVGAALAPLGARAHRLAAHRMLLVGPASWGDAPPGPHQTTASRAPCPTAAFLAVADAAGAALGTAVWPWGACGDAPIPQLHPPPTVVTPGGPAAGIAQLLGCAVVTAAGRDAVEAAVRLAVRAGVVVLHVPDADDAGHARDRPGKVRALERLDALVGALATRLAPLRATLAVCPDHGCDPLTGRHTAEPVPALVWREGVAAPGPARRWTEEAARALPEEEAADLLAGLRYPAGVSA